MGESLPKVCPNMLLWSGGETAMGEASRTSWREHTAKPHFLGVLDIKRAGGGEAMNWTTVFTKPVK